MRGRTSYLPTVTKSTSPIPKATSKRCTISSPLFSTTQYDFTISVPIRQQKPETWVKEHLSVLEFKREKRKEELAELEQSIERVQQQQVSVQAVEQIEAKPLPLTSKVAVDKEDFQNLVTAAQKFVVQEKQESKLKKLLKDAKKTIADLKAKIESLVTELTAAKAELAKYKSVRGQLRTADLEKENDRLRSRLRTYEDVISRNNLWHFFSGSRGKNRNRDDAR